MKSFKTKIIAISNQKGVVGKTTSAVNIASFLAITETPTLLIDMDPQANASSSLGIETNTYGIYECILYKINVFKCIHSMIKWEMGNVFKCSHLIIKWKMGNEFKWIHLIIKWEMANGI